MLSIRGADARPTPDIDTDRLRANLKDHLAMEVEEDGIACLTEAIVIAPIRLESPVLGLRAHFDVTLGRTRLRYQVDVGLGDAVPQRRKSHPAAFSDRP